MSFATYEEFYDYYAPKIASYPQRDDFMKVLDWAADKPCEEVNFRELALVIDPDSDPSTGDMVNRVVAIAPILTAWSRQIGVMLLKVKSANGQFYEVDVDDEDVFEGKKPFVLEATGETFYPFQAHACPFIRFRDFEPRLEPKIASNVGPKV